jgi:hypothetical protein
MKRQFAPVRDLVWYNLRRRWIGMLGSCCAGCGAMGMLTAGAVVGLIVAFALGVL